MALASRIARSPGSMLSASPRTLSGTAAIGGRSASSEAPNALDSMLIDKEETAWDASTDDGFEGLLAHPVVNEFLAELRTLHAMLYSLAAFPSTVYFENERTEAALTLVGFLRRTHREDIFTKYVHFLEEVHAQAGNTVEEAMTHTLHASLPMHPIIEAF